MQRRAFLAAPLASALLPGVSRAAAFPEKAVRIVVPATPGGTSDILARAIAGKLQERFGKPVLVEYRPGAGTNIGTQFVARSPADGHTLLINGITLATNPSLYEQVPFDPVRDFAPIIEVGEMANVVTVHPSVPAGSLKELVAQMKADPDKYSYGTPGAGSSGHLSGELLALGTGARLLHVPYQGNAQATTDHVGGILPVGFVNLPVALPFIKSGRLKALAVTAARRSPLLPGVPTVAEALGLKDYQLTGWFGLLAPAGTPAPIVATLQRETALALADAGVRDKITVAGVDVVSGSTAEFAARLRADTARLSDVLRRSGAAVR